MRLLTILSLLLLSSTAHAQELFGLAMVGEAKYGAKSTHLDYANPDAPKNGVLKQASIGTFDTVNPYTIKGNAADGLNLTTDKLMGRVWDEPFTLYPLIAKSVSVPEDRSSIAFTLNEKARFHDGSAITAQDVLFSFETLREFGRPNMRRLYQLATPEILDQGQIKFSLSGDYDRETVMILAMMPILSKAYWQDKDFNKTTLEPPLSNGPYRIKEIEAGRKISYERVPDYWGKDLLVNKGHHNFDVMTYDYFRDDTVALEAFKKGDLSLRREWDAGAWNNSYNFDALEKGYVVKENIEHGRAERIRGFIFNTRRPPFDDINVRHALNLLFDFDWANKNFFFGQYKQVNSFFPNTDLGNPAPSDSRAMREKMREASRLLDKAGWVIKNGKRIHTKTGAPFTFQILTDTPSAEKLALSFTRSLQKMGIEANVRVMDTAAYRARLNDYDYDMILYHWNSTLSPGTEQYLYWSCESAKTPSRWNYAGICDPSIDALAKAIPSAKTRSELQEMAQNLDSKLMSGQYFVPTYYNPYDFVAYWKPLKRPENVPLYGMVLETWWMEPAQGQ
ncbi:MAG: ABC transporter substrate-binding protein [Alphaproteobacteria bacterium]|nr:ABC transporter substrate-binding protein [Alphaproteobacteria bacterium]NCQ88306.1 ABC transporter substrate-binding protein [Alphaproteobacteria bacterium]NCT05187.1 ABC transporter substrate-binding protein [Alphaproteobacteria bacterium]